MKESIVLVVETAFEFVTTRLPTFMKDFAIYGAGDFLVRAAPLLTLPVYARVFTPGDYGVWILVLTVGAVLAVVLELGGNTAYARYVFEAKTEEEKQRLTSTWLFFLGVWGIAIILILAPLAAKISSWTLGTDRFAQLFVLSFITAAISTVNLFCGSVLRNQFRSRETAFLNVMSAFLTAGFGVFALLVLHRGLPGVVGGGLIAASVMLPVRLWTVRHFLIPRFTLSLLQKMLRYGLPLVPMSAAYWIFLSSDRIVLGKLSTPQELGLYGVANNFSNILIFLTGSFGQAWAPHALFLFEQNKHDAAIFFGRVMTELTAAFGLLALCVTVFAHEALLVLVSPLFYPAAKAVGPLALGCLAYATTQITALGISLGKKTHHFVTLSWAAAGLNLGLNLWGVPRWGMMASSWATAISYAFLTVAYAVRGAQFVPIQYEGKRLTFVTLLIFFFVMGAIFLPSHEPAAAGIKLVYVAAFFILLALSGGVRLRKWIVWVKENKQSCRAS